MSDIEIIHGIEYSKPTVILMQETGIGTAEYAARTCYDSFDSSENESIKIANEYATMGGITQVTKDFVNNIEHSNLLDDLAWTYFHHSILEHANLSFLVRGTSRGVLQEHARHRIQAISVRSTRYTMSSVINAFATALYIANKNGGHVRDEHADDWFIQKIISLDMFVVSDKYYQRLEAESILNKLHHQLLSVESYDYFINMMIAKSSLGLMKSNIEADKLFDALQEGKKKRNVGDAFKHIVTDNFKVDMVVTMNLRALKNYLTLRDSGAAHFQTRWLAQKIKDATPSKYLDLIIKSKEATES